MSVVHANGAAIPAIGLGTWQLRGADCARARTAGIASAAPAAIPATTRRRLGAWMLMGLISSKLKLVIE